MIIKHRADQTVVNTATCGEVHEILKQGDYKPLGVAVCFNIKSTEGHYHQTFDETYFVLDGQLTLKIYDPSNQKISTLLLNPNELCVISKGLHHKVVSATEHNRLCVISSPPFHADDEHPSDKI